MLKEFKDFVNRGGIFETAVGLIMALAFVPVINSIVDGIFMPIIAAIVGEPNFDGITIGIGEAEILIGSVITAVVSFLAIAAVVFLMVKAYDRAIAKQEDEAGPSETDLLIQIRDLLAK